jgi:hypothetical protein
MVLYFFSGNSGNRLSKPAQRLGLPPLRCSHRVFWQWEQWEQPGVCPSRLRLVLLPLEEGTGDAVEPEVPAAGHALP